MPLHGGVGGGQPLGAHGVEVAHHQVDVEAPGEGGVEAGVGGDQIGVVGDLARQRDGERLAAAEDDDGVHGQGSK